MRPLWCSMLYPIKKKNLKEDELQNNKFSLFRRYYSLAAFTLRLISVSALCQGREKFLAQDDFMWSS